MGTRMWTREGEEEEEEECPTTGARALDAAHSEKSRSAHTGALHKRCRLAQQEPVGCDISAAGCWERGDERAEALEWQI